jgi:hypothetical protein
MRRIVSLISAGLLAAASFAAAGPAVAITNTYVPDNDHPFVGLVAFYDAEGEFSHRCSGSLINSMVFVTAGHCTDDGAGGVMDSARIWFRQDAGAQFDGVQDPRTGYPDACLDDPAVVLDACVTAHEMYNYGFDNFAGFPNIHDTGVVILDAPVVLSEYASLAPDGTLDAIQARKGSTTLTVSGYGISEAATKQTPALSFRVRLMGTATLHNLVNPYTDGYNVSTQGRGGWRAGTCSGDSGGPVFYPADSNQIVAITSVGLHARCLGVDYAYRVDRGEVVDWIDDVAGAHWNQ